MATFTFTGKGSGLLVIVVIAIAGLVWIGLPKSVSLFDTYYQPLDTVVFVQNKASADYNHKLEAFRKYQARSWDGCLVELNQIEQPDGEVELLKGLANLEMNRGKNPAIQHLANALKDPALKDNTTVQWYYALALIHGLDFKQAQPILQSIAAQPGRYQESSSQLLKELKK